MNIFQRDVTSSSLCICIFLWDLRVLITKLCHNKILNLCISFWVLKNILRNRFLTYSNRKRIYELVTVSQLKTVVLTKTGTFFFLVPLGTVVLTKTETFFFLVPLGTVVLTKTGTFFFLVPLGAILV